MFIKIAHTSAVVSVCSGLASWLPHLETGLRFASILVALAAGILSLLVHLRNYRKEKQKK